MKRYIDLKNTEIEWVGQIPADWSAIKVRFICDITTGDKDTINRIDNGKYPFYVRSPIVERIDTYSFDGEGVLMAGDGVGAGRVFHYATGKFDYHQRVYNLHNFRKVIGRYFFYFMQENFYKEIERSNAKSTVDSIRLNMIKAFVVTFPASLNEQKEIVDYLDRRTAEIDGLLADLAHQAEMLDRYKRELIVEAVTKGLDKSATMNGSGVDWIGATPEAWEILPLFAVVRENNVKNTGMACENLLSLSYGKIVRKDIETNFGLLPASFEGYQIVQPGYTVLRFTDLQNDKRSLRSGYVKEIGIITSAYMGLIPGERLDSKYFNYLLHAYDLLKVYYGMGGGLRQTLKFSDVKRLPVLIPTIAEQEAIAAYVDAKTAQVEGLIADIAAQIEKLKQYRQIVIHDAVTGKIKVTEG